MLVISLYRVFLRRQNTTTSVRRLPELYNASFCRKPTWSMRPSQSHRLMSSYDGSSDQQRLSPEVRDLFDEVDRLSGSEGTCLQKVNTMLQLTSTKDVHVTYSELKHKVFTDLTQGLLEQTNPEILSGASSGSHDWEERDLSDLVACQQYAYIIEHPQLAASTSECIVECLKRIDSSQTSNTDQLLENCMKLFQIDGTSLDALSLSSQVMDTLVSRLDLAAQGTQYLLNLLEAFYFGINARSQVLLQSTETVNFDGQKKKGQLLTASLVRALDNIGLELASRVNELSADQIANLCYSLANFVNSYLNDYWMEDEQSETPLEDILSMKLILAELASEGIIQCELKTFSHDQFPYVYRAYLNAGLLNDAINGGRRTDHLSIEQELEEAEESKFEVRDDSDQVRMTHPDVPQSMGHDQSKYTMDFSAHLHDLFVTELRQRRLNFVHISDIVKLLHAYVHSGSLTSKHSRSQRRFIELCDKQLGKKSDEISANDMEWVMRLFWHMRQQGTEHSLNQKLLIKLQRQVLYLYDWRQERADSKHETLDVNQFAFITRIYAENGITLTDLFDELAESLESELDSLSEDGFSNAYISLTKSKFAASRPSGYHQGDLDVTIDYSNPRVQHSTKNRHRTALVDLEDVLYGNMERFSLDALADLHLFFMSIVKQQVESKKSTISQDQYYENHYGRLADLLEQEILKVLRSTESITMLTLARLFQGYQARFQLLFGGDEEMRRSRLQDADLEPYRLIGTQIENVAGLLSDQDIIEMIPMFTELDQSYEGFYKGRKSLELSLKDRNLNDLLKLSLQSGMNIQ